MRKVTKQAIDAFIARKNYHSKNTRIETEGKYTRMYLHGNLIANLDGKKLYIQNAGWFSNTTKERLNGIPGVSIQQKKGVWYLNGKQWDGNRILVIKNFKP